MIGNYMIAPSALIIDLFIKSIISRAKSIVLLIYNDIDRTSKLIMILIEYPDHINYIVDLTKSIIILWILPNR